MTAERRAVEARLWQRAARRRGPGDPDLGRGHGADRLARLPADERAVDLELTFTAMGCPAMDFIQDDIRERLLRRARGRRGAHRGRLGPGVDAQPHPRGRARDDARAGDRGMSTDAGPVWEVFARKAYEEPLHHVGTVTEDDEDLALVSARSIYDEQPWIHMIIVPRTAIREAIQRMSATARPTTRPGCMASLVGSLADNKAALGRRYAEWARERARRSSPPSPPPRWPRTSSATRAPPTRCSRRSAPRPATRASTAATAGWRCSTTSCPTGPRSSPPTCSSTAC